MRSCPLFSRLTISVDPYNGLHIVCNRGCAISRTRAHCQWSIQKTWENTTRCECDDLKTFVTCTFRDALFRGWPGVDEGIFTPDENNFELPDIFKRLYTVPDVV